jgi:hypothetical protein
MKKMNRKAVYVRLRYQDGRVAIKKLMMKARTLEGIQKEYLGTDDHFRTEAYPIAIVEKTKIRKTGLVWEW